MTRSVAVPTAVVWIVMLTPVFGIGYWLGRADAPAPAPVRAPVTPELPSMTTTTPWVTV